MEVNTVGPGKPEIAVVACIHGDEPCGKTAIGRFLSQDPVLDRSVMFIVANEKALEHGDRYVDTGMETYCDGVAAECGIQGTDDAAANALAIIERFLTAYGAMPGTAASTEQTWYRAIDAIPQQGNERATIKNFERVDAGQVFAEAPDRQLTAEEPFYPVLMAEDAYDGILGFRAERIGTQDCENRER